MGRGNALSPFACLPCLTVLSFQLPGVMEEVIRDPVKSQRIADNAVRMMRGRQVPLIIGHASSLANVRTLQVLDSGVRHVLLAPRSRRVRVAAAIHTIH